MSDIITDIEQVTPEWLTETLRRSGALQQGTVTSLHSQPVSGRDSHQLTAAYSDDAAENAPIRLFLKLNAPAIRLGVPGLGKKEVEFYNAIAGDKAELPVPRCYDALYSDEDDCYHLLLEDLSETHVAVPASQLPPTDAQCEQIVDALAQIHAYWWEHPQLGETVGERPTAASVRAGYEYDMQDVAEFIEFLGDRLSTKRRKIYDRVTVKLLPHLLKRLTTDKPLTMIFEDVHIGNFLYPRDALKDRLVIVDWEQWAVSIGANDLSYMMAVFWFPERRERLERRLLEQYLGRLQALGVKNYYWDDLWYDYRLSVAHHLLMPAWRWKHNTAPDIWWNHLERLMMAYDDLDCEALFK